MVGIGSTTPQTGIFHINNVRFDPSLSNFASFIQFSGWFFLNSLALPCCLPSFPPQKTKKETQAPHLGCVWLPAPGDFPWIPWFLPPLPRCPEPVWGCPSWNPSLQHFGPSSGLSVTFWEGWNWGQAPDLLPQEIPNLFFSVIFTTGGLKECLFLRKGQGKVKMWELLIPLPGPIHLWHFS